MVNSRIPSIHLPHLSHKSRLVTSDLDTLKPVNTVAPAVSGITYTGQELTVTPGTWINQPDTVTRQWRAGGSPIAGETSTTYTVTYDVEGMSIDCLETASNEYGSTDAASNAVHNLVPSDISAVIEWWSTTNTDNITSTLNYVSLHEGELGNYDLAQITGSAQPATGQHTIGGLNTLSFSFADQAGSIGNLSLTETLSEVNVVGINEIDGTAATNFDYWFSADHTNGSGQPMRVQTGGDGDDIRANSSAGATAETSIGDNTPTVFSARFPSGATVGFRVNGTEAVSSYTETTITDLTGFTIGIDTSDSGNNFRGWYGDQILAGALTPAEIQKLEGFIAHKFGRTAQLAAGHTYKSTAPTP